jgi:DNA-binding beta-propeller fold protein YncE
MSDRSALRLGVLALLVCAFAARAQIVLYTVDVGDSPNALVVDTIDDKVFVSCEGSDSVYVLDARADSPEEFVIGRVPVGDWPTAVVWNHTDNTIWVVNRQTDSATGSVTAIDAENDSVIATIEVGARPTKASWASACNKLYTLHLQTVTAIDCSTNQKVGTIRIPDSAYFYTDMVYHPFKDRLYLVSRRQQDGESYMHVVDCSNDQIVQSVGLADGAEKIGYAPSVNRLFVACNTRTLNVIDCASNLVIAWLPISEGPTDVIWSTTPVNRIWIACEWAHTVHYMQADRLEIEGRVNTPNQNPRKLLYTPYSAMLLAASEQTHEVIFYNARTPAIIDTVRLAPFSHGPYDMALYPQMNRVFVANYWDERPGTVSVLICFVGIDQSVDRWPLLPSRAMPNPVRAGRLVMLQTSGFEPTQATLLDATARAVYQGDLGRNGTLAAPEAPGVYFYTVTDGRLTSSGKFTVR